jgi:diguanylate cyclase (GGDEF)-like protein/PAS domain S-box-containing protein
MKAKALPKRRSTAEKRPDVSKKAAAKSTVRPTIVVAVGSSAGGLQALKDLLTSLDPSAGASFVLAQHVSPTHQSLLAELLSPKTNLRVRYLNKPMVPLKNSVLIVPPNADVIVQGGKVVPQSVEGVRARGPRPSIDRLFTSLASEFGERAVGIVLSGTGTDGAAGAAAIKAAGGIVLVQDPKTAQFDAMPLAVIQSNLYDAVLSPSQMGAALVRIASAQGDGMDSDSIATLLPEKAIHQIKLLVRKRTGLNLSHYKGSTVLRRVHRRMQLAGCMNLDEYLAFLTGDAEEAKRLAGDLSVRVTSFFRDPLLFKPLNAVIVEKVRRLAPGDVLRIWVPGCASGEEAYSIAILIMEAFRAARALPSFLMFVSDINPESVAMARNGKYPEASLEKLPEPLRKRYFDFSDGIAEVNKGLKQYLVFAAQNVIEDPPFSKLDLISCRNLLIYFEIATQKHVVAAFHYALKPQGTLFLGASESIEIQKDLFEVLDAKARLYTRRDHAVVYQYQAARKTDASVDAAPQTTNSISPRNQVPMTSRKAVMERTRDIVAEHYSPPAIIIDTDDRIIHFVGDLSPFVTLPRGPTHWTAHQLVMAPLNVEMRALLHRCRKEKISIRGGSYTLDINGQLRRVTLAAHPDVQDKNVLVMLAFETRNISDSNEGGQSESVNLVRELERELASTREHLQTLVEEVETSNEELQTVNEELQSSNEELQSTNEEMQTSNEELQSTNEELLTVNEELSNKTEELQISRADLVNIKEALEIGVLAVDEKLAVTQFNQTVSAVVNADSLRIGQPLGTLDWLVPFSAIIVEALEVITSQKRQTRVIVTPDERHLRLSIVPYKVAAGSSKTGAVLCFLDITAEVLALQREKAREALYRIMLESSQTGTFLLDTTGVIQECNPAAAALSGHTREELVGSPLEMVLDHSSVSTFRSQLQLQIASKSGQSSFDGKIQRAGEEPLWMTVSIASVSDPQGLPSQLVVQLQDIHTMKRRQDRLVAEHSKLRFLNNLSRRVLESESIQALNVLIVSDLSVYFDDQQVSYLKWNDRVGFIRQLTIAPGGQVLDNERPQPIKLPNTDLRKLRNLELVQHATPPAQAGSAIPTGKISLSVPVTNGNALTGAIYFESETARDWSEYDLDLLRAIADMMSVAARDASSRLDREDAFKSLNEQRERVEITLRSISDAVITTNTEGQIESMNPPAVALCGVELNQCLGKSLFNVYRVVRGEAGLHVPNVVERCLQEANTIEDSSLDLYLLQPSGKRVPINHSASPILDPEGAVTGAVLVCRDVTETRLLARELSHRAAHDPLTELPNREEFDRRAEMALQEAQAGVSRHALIAIDLDHFKPVNDAAGHAAGDALLRKVAQVGRAVLREADTLARVGGDEFSVLLRNCGQERAMEIAQSLVKAIGEIRFEWGSQVFAIGASAGVAMMSSDTTSLSTLLDTVDAACYSAKRKGRGRVELSDQKSNTPSTESQMLEMVRTALRERRCELVIQPAQPLSDASLPSYREFLVRLRDRNNQQHGPDDFVVTARRHQLVHSLDLLVAQQALMQQAQWLKQRAPSIFGINLFPESIYNPDMLSLLSAETAGLGLDPASICLEIPESASTRDLQQLQQFARRARAAGFKLAMDQFGSQLSSFSVLRNLQLDYVKINFRPQDLSSGRAPPVDQTVLEALCHICQRSNIRTIAVGVESETQLDALRELGLDYFQGSISGTLL